MTKLSEKEQLLIKLNCLFEDCQNTANALINNEDTWDLFDADNYQAMADIVSETIQYIKNKKG